MASYNNVAGLSDHLQSAGRLQAWLHDAAALCCFDPTTVGATALSLQDQSLFPLETERVFKTFFIHSLCGVQDGNID